MKLLIDTSAWISHFRGSDDVVAEALAENSACCHEMVIGELALGSIPARDWTLSDLRALPMLPTAAAAEILELVENHGLHGKGLGWVDVNLILSCLMHEAVLYSRDAKLTREWNRLTR